jgi:hypothetical protein
LLIEINHFISNDVVDVVDVVDVDVVDSVQGDSEFEKIRPCERRNIPIFVFSQNSKQFLSILQK